MWRIISIFVLIIICSNLVNGEPQVPCYFIFGDSLSDAGNNNKLTTMAKSNYTPYGVDFQGGIATGRFTNGLTIPDFITQLLGFEKFITTYSSQMEEDILRGVNFASGAAGILMETGSQLGDRVWMDRQLRNYQITISKLQTMVLGPVSNYLNKCLYTVNIGSNDYLNNYFMPQFYPTKRLFNINQFAALLVARYRTQLQTLYNSGARKIAVYDLGKLGCTPAALIMYNATECVQEINKAVDIFNTKLESLVDDLNAKLPGASYTLIKISAIQASSPLPAGIIASSTCCKLRSDFQCEPNTPPCAIRDLYAFFDGYHPTEVINKIGATISYNSPNPMFVHPVDISRLANSQLQATY